MKKNLLGILFCGILLLGLTGCKNERVDNKVSLTVKEGTLAPIGVTLILKNESRKKTLRILFKVMDDLCFHKNLLGHSDWVLLKNN